jgi:hypothetical protein
VHAALTQSEPSTVLVAVDLVLYADDGIPIMGSKDALPVQMEGEVITHPETGRQYRLTSALYHKGESEGHFIAQDAETVADDDKLNPAADTLQGADVAGLVLVDVRRMHTAPPWSWCA